jgi:hypothetical protein
LVDLPYWRGTVDRAVGGKLLYERSGLQQQNYCRKIFETNFDHFTGKIFVIYDPALQRIRLRFQFRIRNYLAQIFNNKKFVQKKILPFPFSMLEVAFFPESWPQIFFFLTFVLHFFVGSGSKSGSGTDRTSQKIGKNKALAKRAGSRSGSVIHCTRFKMLRIRNIALKNPF